MKHQADLLIRNSDYLDETFELTEGKSILISGGKIEAVGTAAELEERYQWKEELDGSGCIYMPGLVDSHMHTGQQLLRGRVLDEMPMIWTRIMLPYESTLTPEKMRLSAQAAAVEMIHAGTTGFIDAGSYFMEEAAKRLGEDFYVLPSSIHEVILIPDTPDVSALELQGIVQSVNVEQVAPEERLSDHIYHYDSKE